MATRPVDECWEALVDETQAVPEVERGALNQALRAIRAVCSREGIHPDSIPQEIHLRADAYRRTFPNCSVTPMALAKHWKRVMIRPQASVEEQALAALRHPTHGSVTL